MENTQPFNGHPKLPLSENGGWLYFRDPVDGDPVPVAPTLIFSRKHNPRPNGGPFFQSGWTYPTKEQAEAAYAFITHAANTYYQREAELQSLRSRVEALEKAGDRMRDRLIAYGAKQRSSPEYSDQEAADTTLDRVNAWDRALNK